MSTISLSSITSSTEQRVWLAAILLFGVGDVVTTYYGIETYPAIAESHPVADQVLEVAGYGGMVATKVLILAAAYYGYKTVPKEWAVGIPIGLALTGAVICANNAVVIATARNMRGA